MIKEYFYVVLTIIALILMLSFEDWIMREDDCKETIGHVVELGSRDCDNN